MELGAIADVDCLLVLESLDRIVPTHSIRRPRFAFLLLLLLPSWEVPVSFHRASRLRESAAHPAPAARTSTKARARAACSA